MAERSQTLTLAAGPEEAAEICREALRGLGWEPAAGPGRLVAEEPSDGLCCVIWPVRVEVGVRPDGSDRSRVELEFSIPGRGLIQSRQLRDRMRAVCLRIVRVIDRTGRGAPTSRRSGPRRDRAGSPAR